MKDQEAHPAEVKYSPEYFVNDFMALSAALKEKAWLMRDIEFSDIQKAYVAGIIMGTATTFGEFTKKLKEWGYMT